MLLLNIVYHHSSRFCCWSIINQMGNVIGWFWKLKMAKHPLIDQSTNITVWCVPAVSVSIRAGGRLRVPHAGEGPEGVPEASAPETVSLTCGIFNFNWDILSSEDHLNLILTDVALTSKVNADEHTHTSRGSLWAPYVRQLSLSELSLAWTRSRSGRILPLLILRVWQAYVRNPAKWGAGLGGVVMTAVRGGVTLCSLWLAPRAAEGLLGVTCVRWIKEGNAQ